MPVLLCNSSPIIDLFTAPRLMVLSAMHFQNNNNTYCIRILMVKKPLVMYVLRGTGGLIS